jgi:hypothetical protein
MHVSYDQVLKASAESKMHPYDFRYVIVGLGPDDQSANPASTKHNISGPGVWLWEIHASGVTAREYDSAAFMPKELVDGAATICTCCGLGLRST